MPVSRAVYMESLPQRYAYPLELEYFDGRDIVIGFDPSH